jgi:hypothetical protein
MKAKVEWAVALVAGGLVAWYWVRVPTNPADVRLLSISNVFVLVPLGLILVGLTGLVLWRLLGVRVSVTRKVGALALGVAITAGVVWLQRFTDVGVFAGRGSRYWVGRAAASNTETEALACLEIVLSATQYGVNVAENCVMTYPPPVRARLFKLLAGVAPTEAWRDQYLRRAAEAQRT